MVDNSQDKGYIYVTLRKNEGFYELRETKIYHDPDEELFYVDYENGTIFIDYGDGDKDVIGFYDSTTDTGAMVNVYDNSRKRIIGRVGKELIFFQKEANPTIGRFLPIDECLAFYSPSGSITEMDCITYMGIINGSQIGGAAAFVALFYSFLFKSKYRDFYEMDYTNFKSKYNL